MRFEDIMIKTKSFLPYLMVIFFNAFVDLGHKILIQNTLFETTSANHYTIASSILNALILLPYILIFTPSGFLSDKFAKVSVMRITAMAAIPLTLLITLCYYKGWFWAAFSLTLLLGFQSAINSPAKYGYIKEIFGKSNIARANAYVQTVAIVAILAGTIVFTLLFAYFINGDTLAHLSKAHALKDFAPLGFILVFFSCFETLCSYFLVKKPAVDPESHYEIKQYLKGHYLKSYFSELTANKIILICIIGLSLFWGVNQVLLASYGAYLKTYVTSAGPIFAQGSLAIGGIGILLGSMYAGRVSKGFIETGIIPIGAIGLTIGMAFVATLTSKIAICLLFIIYGFFGGMLIVPLNSLIQFHAKPHQLGKILAGNNFMQNVFMVSFLMLTTIGTLMGFDAKINLHILFALMLVASVGSIFLLPQSLVRYLVYFMISKFYHIDVKGLNNLPSSGGALLLGNHTSFLDWAIVQIASPRPVRFVMERAIYKKWYLHWILKHLGVIPIATGASKEALKSIHQALIDGDVVAIFPEGALSRNGQLGTFHTGFERAAKNSGATIVPFFIRGLWGTQSSYANAHYKNLTKTHHRHVSMAFGSPLNDSATTTEVKQAVTALSVTTWRQYADQLQSIPTEWLKRAKRMGRKAALEDSVIGTVSYTKLMALVFHLTKRLKPLVGRDQNIGLLLPTSAAGIAANLSQLCLAKTVVNINYTASHEAIAYSIEDASINTIITSKLFIKKLTAKGFDMSGVIANKKAIYLEDLFTAKDKINLARRLMLARILPAFILRMVYIKASKPDSTAAILFSSGSEGKPKGVLLSHKNLLSNMKQVASVFNIRPSDKVLSCLPLFHAFGLTVTSLMPVIEGIPAICHPDPTDARTIGRLIYKHQASVLCSTSSILGLYNRNHKMLPQMLSCLRFVIAGAEKLSPCVYDAFKQKFNIDIYEGYGTTELSPVASSNLPDILSASDWHMHKGAEHGTVGLPLPGTAFKIVDPNTLDPLPTGDAGLILISGPQLMQGYLNNPEKTAAVLCNIEGITWYKTGDKGFLNAEGFLSIVDRYSRFAKIAGEMVSLSAIEQHVQQCLPDDYADIMALALPDDKKGEKIVLLHTVNNTDIKHLLQKSNMNKLLLPKEYLYMAELPKLGSGKKDYAGAKQHYLSYNK
jgi:acyl-[acyl-carrier-protein]-phospholipid O-acyltransferase / long-chain-fatty-acid--[acyl-carrier-protein] ligase